MNFYKEIKKWICLKLINSEIEMNTENPSKNYQLAIEFAERGMLKDAIARIEEAIDYDNSSINYRLYKAYIQFLQEDYYGSLETYDYCLEANPTLESIWKNRNIVAQKCAATRSIELGCGNHHKNPFNAAESFGIDIREDLGKNIYSADLSRQPIPFPENYFDFVVAEHFIEHIPRLAYTPEHRFPFIELMNEIWRVLKPHGLFYAITPAYPHAEAFQDPTHVNIITEKTFPAYFCYALPWAHQYGFYGRFNFTKQDWEGPCLRTWMNKVSKL